MIVDAVLGEELVEQRALHGVERLFAREVARHVRDDDVQAPFAAADFEPRLRLVREDRLLDEEDAAPAREAAQEVLRPLVDEVPAQVRQADEVRRFGFKL